MVDIKMKRLMIESNMQIFFLLVLLCDRSEENCREKFRNNMCVFRNENEPFSQWLLVVS